MKRTKNIALVMGALIGLAACTETQPAARSITVDPIMNKYDNDGGGGCPAGQTAGGTGLCLPPTDPQQPDTSRIPQPTDPNRGQGGSGEGTGRS